MRLVQFNDRTGGRKLAIVSDDGGTLQLLSGIARTYDLAQAAAREKTSLETAAGKRLGKETER